MKKYLVTGGAGFIGSHLVEALLADGHQVVVLDNLSSGKKENLSAVWNEIEFIEGDIRSEEDCLRATEGCNGIFHEAALVSVPDSIERPRDNHAINITGTFNLLEAARANGLKRFVYASSAAVYGDNPELPKREDMLPEPKSPYALAKLAGEQYLSVYAECYGLETVALRYFNVFGPRQDPTSPYSGVISIFADSVSKGKTIEIFGDGRQTRDFIYVADIVQANVAAMHSEKAPSATLNVATGKQTSLLELLATLEKIEGREVARVFKGARSGDIKHSQADIALAQRTLGYNPRTSLEKGLETIG